MDSPLDFLRNWLPLGRRDDNGDDAQTLRAWLDEMSGAPTAELLESLALRLAPMAGAQKNLHMRVKLIDTFDEIARDLLPPLEQELGQISLPLSPAMQAKALAADNLLKALASAYAAVLGSIEARHLASGLVQLAQQAAQQAIIALRRRQLLACRVYANPSASSWQHLHELHQTCVRLGLMGKPRTGLPIEQLYYSTLLLAYADPGKFARTELDTLLDCAEIGAGLIHARAAETIKDAHPETALFVVDPKSKDPGKPLVRTRASNPKELLYLDCTSLAAGIRSDIGAKSRIDVQPHPWLFPKAPLPMLRTLAAMWGAQPTRRFSRMRFKPRADLVIGLFDVSLFLAGGAFRRRQNDHDYRPGKSPAISEWLLIDESPDGFGVRYRRGELGSIEVGDVVGIRPRESSQVQICLVRRVSNAGQARFEIGLQNLSPHALVVDVPGLNGHGHSKGVLLPRMPAYNNAAGLLSVPGSVPAGLEIAYPAGDKTLHLKLAQRVEGNTRNDFHLMLPPESA
ncbi:MAG: hypothetical protein H6943_07750 [Zoogloeaceae bacterium]|nr:hypothetical protein [Zoogloeaceae bacterium]